MAYEKSEQPVSPGMFEKSNGMFGNKSHMPPSHNPKQPHLGLPDGMHTHSEARKAVHEVNGVKPDFNYAGCMTNIPSASSTPKSEANKTNVKPNLNAGFAVEQAKNAPKGKKNGD